MIESTGAGKRVVPLRFNVNPIFFRPRRVNKWELLQAAYISGLFF